MVPSIDEAAAAVLYRGLKGSDDDTRREGGQPRRRASSRALEEARLVKHNTKRRPMFVRLRLSDGDELYVHKARNVTAQGLFIDAPVPLAEGTRVQIEFRLADDSTLTCDAEVAWNTDIVGGSARAPHPGFGVVFLDLGDAARERLVTLVGG